METDSPFAGHHDPPFDSAWLKLSHGLAHATTLDAEIDDFSSRSSDEEVLFMKSDYGPKTPRLQRLRDGHCSYAEPMGSDTGRRRPQLLKRA
jgi:hypothetical protein